MLQPLVCIWAVCTAVGIGNNKIIQDVDHNMHKMRQGFNHVAADAILIFLTSSVDIPDHIFDTLISAQSSSLPCMRLQGIWLKNVKVMVAMVQFIVY